MTATSHSDLQRVINKCRGDGCVLLVLVCDDENCDEVTAIWNSEEVASVIGGNKCEKLQLNSGSLEYTNFAQLYPVLVTPAVFIINNDGIPLDMLYGNFTIQELTGKINKAIKAHKNGKTSLLVKQQQPIIQRDSNKAVRSVHTTSSVVNHRRTTQRDKINNNGRIQQTTNNSTMAATSSSGSNVVHRTVQQHRDVNPHSTTKPLASSTTCRLQLKVVNSNNKLIEQFHPSDTLCVVKERASKELGIPLDAIILEKSYPAYRFVVEDEVKSLSELQLTPTAMLIVKQKTTSSWSSLMLSRLIEVLFYLLSLLIWPLQLLSSFVYGSSTSNSSTSQTSGSQPNSRPSNRKDKSWETQRRGNITSFRQDDDDDDQNTYNGNSTQQQ